jgi:hypothetical protein
MIDCKLVNLSGQTQLGRWQGKVVPRIGDKIVTKDDPREWGQVQKVKDVIHRKGDVELHVEYHGSERYLPMA